MRPPLRFRFFFLAAAAWLSACAPSAPTPQFACATVLSAGEHGYHTFRIPALITHGAQLLAFVEGRKTRRSDFGDIDILQLSSDDGGLTWSAPRLIADFGDGTAGNPLILRDSQSGRLTLLTTFQPADARQDRIREGRAGWRRPHVLWSEDGGATWTAPAPLALTNTSPEFLWYATGPGHGIQLSAGPHAGRLVAPADHSVRGDGSGADHWLGAHLLLSDDGGLTWRLGALASGSAAPPFHPNETSVAELDDGAVYLSVRNQNGAPHRLDGVSADGGESLAAPLAAEPLSMPVVQAAVLSIERDGQRDLLLSAPSDAAQRRDMSVRVSSDDGATWRVLAALTQAPAAYSDMVQLDAETVGILYETGDERPYERLDFCRLTLSD